MQRTAPADVPTPPPGSSTSSATAPPKRRRVPITIVDSDAPADTKPTKDLLSPISSRLLSTSLDPKPTASPTAEAGPTPKPEPASFKAAKQVRDEKNAGRVGGGIFRMSGNDTILKTREVPAPTLAPRDPAHPQVQLSAAPGSLSASASSVTPPALLSQPTPRSAPVSPPRTLFEFTRAWDSIPASDTGTRWALLNVRAPISYLLSRNKSLTHADRTSFVPPGAFRRLARTSAPRVTRRRACYSRTARSRSRVYVFADEGATVSDCSTVSQRFGAERGASCVGGGRRSQGW